MTATPRSASAFIAVDPVQDYEESLTILGVYGSLAAAQYAVRQRCSQPSWEPGRAAEVQLWIGDELRATWTYRPDRGWSGREASR